MLRCALCSNPTDEDSLYGGELRLSCDFGIRESSIVIETFETLCKDCGIALSRTFGELTRVLQEMECELSISAYRDLSDAKAEEAIQEYMDGLWKFYYSFYIKTIKAVPTVTEEASKVEPRVPFPPNRLGDIVQGGN